MPHRTRCRGWTAAGEFVDMVSATLPGACGVEAAPRLRRQAEDRRDSYWKMDRAFRSVAHASQTLEQLRRWGVGLRSYWEPWLDTSGASPAGELMFNILASFAQFERSLIAERVRAGMAKASTAAADRS